MHLASFSIAPSLGQRPVKAGASRVTLVAGQEDNDTRHCREWLEQSPDPAEDRVPQVEGRVPESPRVSFFRTKSEDGEITNVFPVLPESEQWLNIPILVLAMTRAASDLLAWLMPCVKV